MAKKYPVRITFDLDEEAAELLDKWINQTPSNYGRSFALRKLMWIQLGLWPDSSAPGWGMAWQKKSDINSLLPTTASEGQDAPATGSRASHLRLV